MNLYAHQSLDKTATVIDVAAIQEFKQYIQLIGRGQRAGKTLTQTQAYWAMRLLLTNQVTAEQRGAFLMLLRVREETAEEIAGFLQAARECSAVNNNNFAVDIDMACYAGKRRHLPWVVLSILCLAQAGLKVFVHGTSEPDSKRLYVSHALEQLGFSLAKNATDIEQHLATHNFAYADLAWLNPNLAHLIQLRRHLGLRSCANTLARMLNPLSATASLQGVYHRHLDEKHAKVATLLDEPNVMVFRGDAGEVERNPERAVEIHHCQHGQHFVQELPTINNNWVTKPRTLDLQHLVSVWRADAHDKYGESAVIGTMTLMLLASKHTNQEVAEQEANALWQTRDRAWPTRGQGEA